MDRTGQGALEYLLLIGGAIVVAVIVIVLLLGSGGSSQQQTARTSSESLDKIIESGAGGNLIANGSLEEMPGNPPPTWPDGWTIGSSATKEVLCYNGFNCVKNPVQLYTQYKSATGSTPYHVAFYKKGDATLTAFESNAADCSSATQIFTPALGNGVSPTNWTKYSQDFTTKSTTKCIQLNLDGTGGASADMVILRK
ncbi:MAG: class III signal peptide-containing protein [Candidatus Diapherotrites archaeon]|uniref:Class III signal peptide-containing protein n=1 Tax=Candidatus Iainarchaeum sp. TaxID=3101447 RepID=A0A8T3YQU8_9ARCH|nr:class III signal peptide-containing protein [Candidatus Diapherotrites archaeon]